MAQIYSNAFVTISADRAKHEDDGLSNSPEEISEAIQEIEHVDKNTGERIAILVSAVGSDTKLEHEFCLTGKDLAKGHLWIEGGYSRRMSCPPNGTVHLRRARLAMSNGSQMRLSNTSGRNPRLSQQPEEFEKYSRILY